MQTFPYLSVMILNKKNVYIILIVFALLFGITIRVLLASFDSFKDASQTSAFQKKIQNLFQQRIKEYEEFKEKYYLYDKTLEKVESSFVAKDAPVRFIEFLESLAKKSDVSAEIHPLNIKKSNSDLWEPVAFRVSLKGSFPNCLRFLEGLEQSSWLIEVTRVDVERIGEKKKKLREFENLEIGDVIFLLNFKAFSNESSIKQN